MVDRSIHNIRPPAQPLPYIVCLLIAVCQVRAVGAVLDSSDPRDQARVQMVAYYGAGMQIYLCYLGDTVTWSCGEYLCVAGDGMPWMTSGGSGVWKRGVSCAVATTPPFDAHAHRCNESGCCCFNGL